MDSTTKKKPKWHKELINPDGSSASYVTGGYLPILRPTPQVAFPTSQVVNITGDDWEPTSPTGTSPVASGGGWGGLPPPPPMGGVGGSGMVRARIAALEAATGAVGGAATGAVASRTYPLFAPTTTVDVGTQTDHMVFPFVFPGGGKWTL